MTNLSNFLQRKSKHGRTRLSLGNLRHRTYPTTHRNQLSAHSYSIIVFGCKSKSRQNRPRKTRDVTLNNLQKFDALIMGVRAYNTRPRLKFHQKTLMEYVEKGGTLIVQYNTSFRLVTEYIAPYQLNLSRDRVTVEGAEVSFLLPEHPVLNTPNKITTADFENWVQERGLYFPNEWDDRYAAVLSSNDPNEPPRNGGLLVAEYGEGHFIYTGYSWFRELPAGVPGAYRVSGIRD